MKYLFSAILLLIVLGLRQFLQNIYIDTFIVFLVFYSLIHLEKNTSIITLIIMVFSLLFSPFAGLLGIMASVYFIITELFSKQRDRIGPFITIILLSFLASIVLYLEDILLSLRLSQIINISFDQLLHGIISVVIGYIIASVYNRYNDQQSKGAKVR